MTDKSAVDRPLLIYAEDSESDQFIVEKVWERISGFRPVCVPNGKELMAYLEGCAENENPWPRLILLDLNMPVMNGYEVLERVKADERFMKLPVVVLSTSVQEEDAQACFKRHANGYLVKDFDLPRLTETLESTHEFWFERVVAPAP